MEEKIYYSQIDGKIEEIFTTHGLEISREFLREVMVFLSTACNYSEEENKIRPRLFFTRNIAEMLKQVPNSYNLKIMNGDLEGNQFSSAIKSIVPFCNNGWIMYIDINSNAVEYGLIRSFSGPQALPFIELIFDEDTGEKGYSIIDIEVVSKYEIKIKGSSKSLLIDFRLLSGDQSVNTDIYSEIGKAITTDVIDDNKREKLSKVFKNLFRVVSHRIHGTIFIIAKEDITFPNDLLSDGIWLENPIDLAYEALNATDIMADPNLRERYYGLTGLFIEMLNMDGITVLNTKGQILGYNVFNRNTDQEKSRVTGGARKRAAESLIANGASYINNVYFQSQDGYSYFKEVGGNE
jgi:hypothetical protein